MGPQLDCIKAQAIDHKTAVNTERKILMLPPLEAIAAEVKEMPAMLDFDPAALPPCYHSNPKVKEAKDQGKPPPLPLALFADGIRYKTVLAGRADAILGIWVRSLTTQRRHLLCSIRVQRMCRCGCRGWCTLHPIMSALAHSFKGLALGRRLNTFWDNTPRLPSDPYGVGGAGDELGFRAVLLYLTGCQESKQ